MSRLQKLYRRLAKVRQSVQTRSQFDRINISDDIKRPPLKEFLRTRVLQPGIDARRTEIQPWVESDINISASLVMSQILFTAKANGPDTNLIAVEIKEGAAAEEAEVSVNGQTITILISTTEDEETTIETVIEAIENNSVAAALVEATLDSGDLSDFAEVAELQKLSGGK